MKKLIKKSASIAQDNKAEKEEKLLNEGFKLFTTKGFINTSIQDIVNKANVAKGTFYLNRKLGYGVINSFSISSSVKKDKYGLIMDAFMKGLDSFIRKYDEIFRHNPIIQINTGISHSLLKIINKKKKKSPELLSVPEEYNFHDAIKEQYILYKRPNQLNIIGDR